MGSLRIINHEDVTYLRIINDRIVIPKGPCEKEEEQECQSTDTYAQNATMNSKHLEI